VARKEGGHCDGDLPLNNYIIAEATLVVEELEEDHQGNNDHKDDTLGLHWDEEADRGGSIDDSASVAIFAIDMPLTHTTEWNCRCNN